MEVDGTAGRSICALGLALLLGTAAVAQRQVVDAELMAGAWEMATPSGIHGIFVRLNSSDQRPLDQSRMIDESTVFRVYHRRPDGYETWGWYGYDKSVSIFDGVRLRAAGLDVSFQAGEHRWSGTWSIDGKTQAVILEAPRPRPGAPTNVLCGEWTAVPESFGRPPVGFTRLHIAESSDGVLTAWGDQTSDPSDQHRGFLVDVKSANPSDFVMEEVTGVCCPGRFEGALSSDRSTLSGNWTSLNRREPYHQTFHRIASSPPVSTAPPQARLTFHE